VLAGTGASRSSPPTAAVSPSTTAARSPTPATNGTTAVSRAGFKRRSTHVGGRREGQPRQLPRGALREQGPGGAPVGRHEPASVRHRLAARRVRQRARRPDTSPESFADLSLTKTDSPDPVLAGRTLTCEIAVSNAGPSAATGVLVLDELPQGLAFLSATASQGTGCEAAGGRVGCRLGSLATGAGAASRSGSVPSRRRGSSPTGPVCRRTSPTPTPSTTLQRLNDREPRGRPRPLDERLPPIPCAPATGRRTRWWSPTMAPRRRTVRLVDSLPREVRLASATASITSATGLAGGCNATRRTVTCTFFGLAPRDSATATSWSPRGAPGPSRTPPR
jgi:uncharacterized repeat protein (TIGR01451 family)